MKCYCDSIIGKLWTLIAGALLVSTLLLGCQPRSLYPSATEAEAAPPPRVTLAPDDVVEAKFFYTPQLDETQTVRPDGKITLQLIGEIDVQGKTPAELREELLKLYAPHLEQLEVAVIVRSLPNRRVFVGGQVMAPGIVDMLGKTTALGAIMQAGGFKLPEAEVRTVVVIRHKDTQRYGYALNLKPALEGGEMQPFFLEPQDIVYVPRTEITKVGQWIDQHINQLIPQTGFFYSRTVGKSTIGIDTSSGY